MSVNSKKVQFLALFLGIIFLAAQLHCCVDLNSRTVDSHVCPICSATGAAIATACLIIAMVPAINRLEVFVVTATIPVVVLRNVGPRAPPAA
jgi:hypothetical protein